MNPLYTATVTSTEGRAGRARNAEGTLDLPLSLPKGLGGSGGPGTNPEELFAAGYSACFTGAVGRAAQNQRVNPGPYTITAKVTIGTDDGGYRLAVELHGSFTDLPREQAQQLMEGAHQLCPYSKAIRGNVDVKFVLA
jgi:lipoyl-dependent peroxiredoxin